MAAEGLLKQASALGGKGIIGLGAGFLLYSPGGGRYIITG